MKILDDLNVCEIRAKLRSLITQQAGSTVLEEAGKSWWNKFRGLIIGASKTVFGSHETTIYNIMEEKDVTLTFLDKRENQEYIITLHGRIDFAMFLSFKGVPMIILFEFTLYEDALRTVKDRLLAYATALYGEYGYPVVPILAVMSIGNQVREMYIMINKNYVVRSLKFKLSKKLLPIILGEREPRHASRDLCQVCDISIRRMCPYYQ